MARFGHVPAPSRLPEPTSHAPQRSRPGSRARPCRARVVGYAGSAADGGLYGIRRLEDKRSGDEGNLRGWRGAPDRRGAAEDVRQPDPREPLRRASQRVRDRGDRHPDAGSAAGPGLRDGRGHQLQQRVGRPGLPRERDRRAPAAGRRGGLPHRRLGRLGRRLRRGRRGHERQGRRRSRAVVRDVGRERPGHRRRRGPDHVVLEQDLGLRGELGLVRPVHARRPLPVLPQAEAPDVGGRGRLHARRRDRLADAARLGAEHRRGRRSGADLGRRGRPRIDGDPDHARVRRAADRRGVRGVQVRVLPATRREGRDQPPRLRPLGPSPRRRRREAFGAWTQGARQFGRAFWDALGERRNPRSSSTTPARRRSRPRSSWSTTVGWW